MSLPANRPVRVNIREIAVSAASPLEARRLADRLPAALERALARLASGAPGLRRPSGADRVAEQVAAAIAGRLEGRS